MPYLQYFRDHLDYHGSLQNYINAKFKLVSNAEVKTVAINLDDEIILVTKKRYAQRNI